MGDDKIKVALNFNYLVELAETIPLFLSLPCLPVPCPYTPSHPLEVLALLPFLDFFLLHLPLSTSLFPIPSLCLPCLLDPSIPPLSSSPLPLAMCFSQHLKLLCQVLGLLLLLLCMPDHCHAQQQLQVEAVFNQSGVQGRMVFSQSSPQSSTIISVSLTGTSIVHGDNIVMYTVIGLQACQYW